jgi:hypothetical protein
MCASIGDVRCGCVRAGARSWDRCLFRWRALCGAASTLARSATARVLVRHATSHTPMIPTAVLSSEWRHVHACALLSFDPMPIF